MIYWAPFLHFYQPPTQFHSILDRICNECYRPIIKMLSGRPNAKVTVNMCGVLTEMLKEHGHRDIIEGLKELGESGKLEFVESAKYHPILTLIPAHEVRRQIELNHKTNSHFFKKSYKTRGFFSPEMCYSNELAEILNSMGYEWMIIEGAACVAAWPLDVIYRVQLGKSKMTIFYRDDIQSNKISFHNTTYKKFIFDLIGLSRGKDIYVITAMDAETFGHHIRNWERTFLEKMFKTAESGASGGKESRQKAAALKNPGGLFADAADQIKPVTVSELLAKFPIKNSKPPMPSSWSTTKEDMKDKNFYPLWKNKYNPIHGLQWKHMDICFKLISTAARVKDNKDAVRFAAFSRNILDKAMHSCQFWWANPGRMWDINMVNRGLMLQEEAIFNAYKAIIASDHSDEIKEDAYYKFMAASGISERIRHYLIEG